MDNANVELINLIKTIAKTTIGADEPFALVIGEVVGTSPLTITLENKMTLDDDFILLTKNTSDWSVDMSVDHNTEDAEGGSGQAQYESHHHGYKGRKTFLVHNALEVGDKVYLLKEQGGQRYIALDRVYNPDRGCKD